MRDAPFGESEMRRWLAEQYEKHAPHRAFEELSREMREMAERQKQELLERFREEEGEEWKKDTGGRWRWRWES